MGYYEQNWEETDENMQGEEIKVNFDEPKWSGTAKNGFQLYLQLIQYYAVLSQEEERELAIKMVKGDRYAKDMLVNCNQRLVLSIARRYLYSEIEIMELIQAGNEGLLQALQRYDPERGRISTYCFPSIRKEILKALNQYTYVNIPDSVIDNLRLYKGIKNKLEAELGRTPKDEDIERAMIRETLIKDGEKDPSEIDIENKLNSKTFRRNMCLVYEALYAARSLNELLGTDSEDADLESIVPDTRAIDPEARMEQELFANALEKAIAEELTIGEEKLFRMLHCWNLTEANVAEQFHYSIEAVRQQDKLIRSKLKKNSALKNWR